MRTRRGGGTAVSGGQEGVLGSERATGTPLGAAPFTQGRLCSGGPWHVNVRRVGTQLRVPLIQMAASPGVQCRHQCAEGRNHRHGGGAGGRADCHVTVLEQHAAAPIARLPRRQLLLLLLLLLLPPLPHSPAIELLPVTTPAISTAVHSLVSMPTRWLLCTPSVPQVVQPLLVTTSAISLATEATRLILKIDDIVPTR